MRIVLIVYAVIVVAVLLWTAIIGLRFKGTLKELPLPSDPPSVTTIVPARNEERNIGRCAQGIIRQNYPGLEMVFVDDDSSDATPDILTKVRKQSPRVKVIHTQGKPQGWNGKQWACYSGAQAASGDWLCFMDADTYAEPDLISRTMAFALGNHLDFLTLQPWYEMRGLWERIVLPAGLTPMLMVYPPHRVNDPESERVIANGQFILIRRDVYDAVDGHAGIRDRMMDDFSLAEAVHRAGYRLFVADGTDVMRVRLYANLREIRSGAIKAAVELTGGWLTSLVALIVNLIVNVVPAALLIWAAITDSLDVMLVMGVTVAFQVLFYAAIRMAAFHAPPWSAITYPVGGLITSAILVDGMFRVATKREIKWKDRSLIGTPELPVKPLELPIRKKDNRQR